ncbi:radical SAM/SPASM domain-containing protein [Desulfatibacillum aliphaticivorans]|uniref:radical SAM/SPASM domain-containing protein n=1 Tax=Desulfatibacillum aliphaticivorans TaxID=218208 RepID=UPI0004159A55|nr:radical SAM protein [Desulfatibacillum aliphaticivorans]
MHILRKEHFGGIIIDTIAQKIEMLDKNQYAAASDNFDDMALNGKCVRKINVEQIGYPLPSNALATPGKIFLELTKRCQLSCAHCYAKFSQPDKAEEMSFSELSKMLQNLASLGTYYIRLTGGEPTVREDFLDIVKVIVGQGMIPSLNTNGLSSMEILVKAVDLGVNDIRVSLDGDESANDNIRGKGAYQKIVSALKILTGCKSSHPEHITINMVLMKANQHCLEHMVELAAQLECSLSIGLLRPVGRADHKQMLSPMEVLEAARWINQLRKEFGLMGGRIRVNYDVFCENEFNPGSKPFPFDNSSCALGGMGFGILSDGRITLCNYLSGLDHDYWINSDGSKSDILKLWHESQLFLKARALSHDGCKNCLFYIRRCNGGCPVSAYAITGSLEGTDPYCVRNAAFFDNPNSQGSFALGKGSELM